MTRWRRFVGRRVSTRLSNVLADEGISSLGDLRRLIETGRFHLIRNVGAVTEDEARRLVGWKGSRAPIRRCRACGKVHFCRLEKR
jgi:hypothetical protein